MYRNGQLVPDSYSQIKRIQKHLGLMPAIFYIFFFTNLS